MKSQTAGSQFGTLVIAFSFALLNFAGLEHTYLKLPSAYAATSQTLEQPAAPLPKLNQVARRIRSITR